MWHCCSKTSRPSHQDSPRPASYNMSEHDCAPFLSPLPSPSLGLLEGNTHAQYSNSNCWQPLLELAHPTSQPFRERFPEGWPLHRSYSLGKREPVCLWGVLLLAAGTSLAETGQLCNEFPLGGEPRALARASGYAAIPGALGSGWRLTVSERSSSCFGDTTTKEAEADPLRRQETFG